MKNLNDKIEAYILSNTSSGKMETINQIKEHFSHEGYDASDILEALRVFSIKHCSNNTTVYDQKYSL